MHSLPDVGPLLAAADFEPHVGKDYVVDAVPKPVTVRLEKIIVRPIHADLPRQPFTLVFTTPWRDLLLEAMYRMQPAVGPPIELFLSPTLTAPGERRYYQAVFS